LLGPLGAKAYFGVRRLNYSSYAEQVYNAIHVWSPEYIPLATPFIGCSVTGPAGMNLKVARGSRGARRSKGETTTIEEELLMLVLKIIARFWNIGSLLLGKSLLRVI
jgi:hypothetical protein